jgi:membrane associated rhomboid family serine protease
VPPDDTKIRGSLDDVEANRLIVLLASAGIVTRLDADGSGGVALYVSWRDADVARRLLVDEDTTRDALAMPSTIEDGPPPPTKWFGRGSAAVFALAIACIAIFALALQDGTAGVRTRLLELGAIERTRIEAGETWRFVTAIFLHFDVGHLLGNLAILLIVGPPLAHHFGPALFVLLFLASGIGGNVASHLIAPGYGIMAGASGAIAGVLGALGGLALRPDRPRRRKSWQTLGALAALYGLLIGFGPQSDHIAHLGGLLCGIALGRWVR